MSTIKQIRFKPYMHDAHLERTRTGVTLDKYGRRRFTGTKQLRQSQLLALYEHACLNIGDIHTLARILSKCIHSDRARVTARAHVCLLRSYPKGFGKALLRLHDEMLQMRPEPVLRQKKAINHAATDVEIFHAMPIGDIWKDGNLLEVYFFLKKNKRLKLPDCWEVPLKSFEEEALRATC